MKGPWQIKHVAPFPGMEYWQPYRLKDVNEPHHSGNEETYGPICETREEAERQLEKAIKEGER